ncbi:MAG: outer membrane protein assembly factor BamA [Ghiorsea sp.]
MKLTSTVAWLWIALFFTINVAYAEDKVIEIAVEGNRYVESPVLLEKIKSKVGAKLSRRQISRDIQSLFATGYFSDVYTEGERLDGGIKLIFMVKENPVIASVEINGNEEVADKKLKPITEIKAGFILSPRVERVTINGIRKAYLEKGFYQVDVDIRTTMLDDGRVNVAIDISEGGTTSIKEIRFIGNTAFTDKELADAIASRSSDFGSWFSSNDVFNKGRFEADAQLLRQFYEESGYLDARIESTRLMLTQDKKYFYLALSIHEGEAFTVSGIELQGDVIPSREILMEKVTLEVDELYAASKLRFSIRELTESVGSEGFAFASVTPSFQRNLDNNTVLISFDIEKGREVYVERIDVSGHTKTKDSVVRRELRQSEGERYDASKLRRSKERLGRLSYIKSVAVSTPKGSSEDKVKMKIDLEEGKSGSFSAGVTYSQLNSLAFTGKVEEQNLFGEGYRANVSGDVGGATSNYSVNLVDPYFMSEDVSASIKLFKSQTDLTSFLQYKEDSSGGVVGMGFALNEYARYSVAYKQTSTTLTDVPSTASFYLRSQEGTAETGEFTQSLSYDTRNRTVSPTEGSLYVGSIGYAGLTGTHQFYETTASVQRYIPLSDFWTLRGALSGGAINGYGGLEAPLYRRYSLGGVGSLRGYSNFGVSLGDGEDTLGGDYKATASLDLIFPLPYMESAGFRGAFFLDSGTVWGSVDTVSEPFDFATIRGSYGFGIEWASPVGPITMNWAKTMNAQENDKDRSFEFSLGRGF